MGDYADFVDFIGFDPWHPEYIYPEFSEYAYMLNMEIDDIRHLQRQGLRVKASRIRKAERLERLLDMHYGPMPEGADDEWDGPF